VIQNIVLNHDGEACEFDLQDRGLAYGDGVFETILVHHGKLVWWDAHWQRLQLGIERLRLPEANEAAIRQACEALATNHERAIVKLIYTRGSGGRGYGLPTAVSSKIILSLHAARALLSKPITVRWCETTLAIQPVLAGIKHLNRLEQVLARAEWDAVDIHEGLMCDSENRVVCATAANIFIRRQGRWCTPIIDRCGIAGVARAWVLENLPEAQAQVLTAEDVMQADAVFLCNAVRGIMPVQRLGERIWAAHPDILGLQYVLSKAQPAFALGDSGGTQ
jgi:4-amino-4-deoxychorismate lyase